VATGGLSLQQRKDDADGHARRADGIEREGAPRFDRVDRRAQPALERMATSAIVLILISFHSASKLKGT